MTMDIRHQISAVRRTVGGRTRPAGEARVATVSQIYDTDQDDLWEVVTRPERIARWFLPVEGELKLGGHYQLTGNAGGTITRCDPPHGFAATWEFGGSESWIEVRLSAVGAGRTRFELEHVALVGDDVWQQFGPAAVGIGWDMALLGLAWHLTEPATALDPADAAAWLATDEARLMMRLSADDWAQASVASGVEPALAREQADRTYATYTGGEAP